MAGNDRVEHGLRIAVEKAWLRVTLEDRNFVPAMRQRPPSAPDPKGRQRRYSPRTMAGRGGDGWHIEVPILVPVVVPILTFLVLGAAPHLTWRREHGHERGHE